MSFRQMLASCLFGTTIVLSCTIPLFGQSVETQLLVRAVSNDAKIIGSNVGGAEITIRDVQTGEVLARGTQLGGTGSTELIMSEPRERGATVFGTEGAGAYVATLELAAPKLVEVTAEGPLGTPQAMQRSSKTIWLVPGRHVLGEGLVIVLNGFIIRLESPLPDGTSPAGGPIGVKVHVAMLCGCPLTPGGMWDSDRIEILARLLNGSEVVAETPLTYMGERSKFGGVVVAPQAGEYELEVLAVDAERANFGRLVHSVTVTAG